MPSTHTAQPPSTARLTAAGMEPAVETALRECWYPWTKPTPAQVTAVVSWIARQTPDTLVKVVAPREYDPILDLVGERTPLVTRTPLFWAAMTATPAHCAALARNPTLTTSERAALEAAVLEHWADIERWAARDGLKMYRLAEQGDPDSPEWGLTHGESLLRAALLRLGSASSLTPETWAALTRWAAIAPATRLWRRGTSPANRWLWAMSTLVAVAHKPDEVRAAIFESVIALERRAEQRAWVLYRWVQTLTADPTTPLPLARQWAGDGHHLVLEAFAGSNPVVARDPVVRATLVRHALARDASPSATYFEHWWAGLLAQSPPDEAGAVLRVAITRHPALFGPLAATLLREDAPTREGIDVRIPPPVATAALAALPSSAAAVLLMDNQDEVRQSGLRLLAIASGSELMSAEAEAARLSGWSDAGLVMASTCTSRAEARRGGWLRRITGRAARR